MREKCLQFRRALRSVLFVLLLGAVGMTKGYAYDFSAVCPTGQTLYYNIKDATNHYVKLTYPGGSNYNGWSGYSKPTGSIILPTSVQHGGVTYSVTEIGEYAFYCCFDLTSLTIGNSITTIGNYAFGSCGLNSVNIPNSVTLIGDWAFSGTKLTGDLIIPNSVISIGNFAFSFCGLYGLSGSIIIPNSVTTIGKGAFQGSNFTGLSMGNSVTSIGEAAFHWSGLTGELILPNSVTTIGRLAFDGCIGLTGVLVIPNSVTTIGPWAFQDCSNFTGLVIGNSVATIDTSAFVGCSGFTGELIIPNSVTTIGPYAFGECSGFTGDLVIPNSVNTISVGAFNTCSGFSGNLIIPNSVTTIGRAAFYNCSGLTGELNIPSSVTTIGKYAFMNCGDFSGGLTIPNSLTSIGDSTFMGCSFNGMRVDMTNIPDYFVRHIGGSYSGSLIIGNSVVSIGIAAFDTLELYINFTSLVLGDSVTTIGISAFAYCSLFTGDLIIPGSVTSIGDGAFYNCIGFTGVLVIPNSVTTIGNCAFQSCIGLTSLIIPSSVVSIGILAFAGCYSLASIIIRAEDPPILGSDAFGYMSQPISVYVPCGSTGAYSSISWGGFTNFEEICEATITVSANPEEGGSVMGGGTVDLGQTCTVTAIANGGYGFVNWTENGESVSTDASYSFLVTCDRNLVANFEPDQSGNQWTPVSPGMYSNTLTIIGVVLIDDVEQYSDRLELGVFCGEECRGSCRPEEFFITHRYLVNVNVFGENGDELTFKLYDHNLGQELELTPPESVTFTDNGYGTPIIPYELNFFSTVAVTASVTPEGAGTVEGTGEYGLGETCTLVATANPGYQFKHWTLDGEVVSTEPTFQFVVTEAVSYMAHFSYVQTDNLTEGWNWWSSCVEQNGINGLEMLQNSLGGAGIRIQAKIGSTDYFEYQGTGYWYGSLNTITNEQMYKIRTSAECSAVLVGDEALPTNHPITLNNGWSWIGYPSGQSVSLEDAFSNFTPEPDDVIKGRYSSSTFVSYNGYELWYGTLNTLEPGQGYMYKSNSNETKTLVFNTGNGNREVEPNITPEGNWFVPANGNYSDNMLVTAVIDMGGQELRSGVYELAAFAGDECRGSVKLMFVAPFNRYEAFLLVYGNGNENETLRFVLTDGQESSQSDDQIRYESDAIVGTAAEPITLHFGTMGVQDESLLSVNIYPNPSKGIFTVEGEGIQKLEVMDTYGQVILSQEVENDFLQINLSDKARGAYLLRVVTTQGITTKKVLVTE